MRPNDATMKHHAQAVWIAVAGFALAASACFGAEEMSAMTTTPPSAHMTNPMPMMDQECSPVCNFQHQTSLQLQFQTSFVGFKKDVMEICRTSVDEALASEELCPAQLLAMPAAGAGGRSHLQVANGTALINEKEDVRVDVPGGAVFVKRGAAVMISAASNLTRVVDLHDRHCGDVRIVALNKELKLSPGSEACLVKGTDPIGLVNRIGLARRRVHTIKVLDGTTMTYSKVHLGHALLRYPALRQLHQSTDRQDRLLLKAIAKTAAATLLLRQHPEDPYLVPSARQPTVNLASTTSSPAAPDSYSEKRRLRIRQGKLRS